MLRTESLAELRSAIIGWKRQGQSIAFVPTMGNLHAGHIELVHAARQHADRVVASIYVNPTQFGEGEDFQSYPRTLEADCRQLQDADCSLVFIPDTETMYPGGAETGTQLVASPAISKTLEGESRPGHFDGVVTVLARLFNMVTPDIAVFGEKDYQQLMVVQHMVSDLAYDIRILPVPTVREADGLAMSSRNGYLDESQRRAAVILNRVLAAAAVQFEQQEGSRQSIEQGATAELERNGFRVDYVAIRRARDLAKPEPGDKTLRILAAAWCGATRLIDNRSLNKK